MMGELGCCENWRMLSPAVLQKYGCSLITPCIIPANSRELSCRLSVFRDTHLLPQQPEIRRSRKVGLSSWSCSTGNPWFGIPWYQSQLEPISIMSIYRCQSLWNLGTTSFDAMLSPIPERN